MSQEKAPIWNSAALWQHIHAMGKPYDYLKEVLGALARLDSITRYHYRSAKNALDPHLEKAAKDPAALELYVFDPSPDFSEAMVISQANLIGLIHSLRNSHDIFAQLIHGVVLLKAEIAISPKYDFQKIVDQLPDSKIKSEILTTHKMYWYKYAHAFSNTVKHRTLVRYGFRKSYVGEKDGVAIKDFSYGKNHYPEYHIEDVLDGMKEVHKQLWNLGAALNETAGINT